MDYIIGTIIQYGSDTIPEGWLLCDGSAVSRTTYADLYAVIGTTFGVGNGSTTFNVPNLKGKVGVGKDGTQTEFDTLGETGGSKELQAHSHKIYGTPNEGSISGEGYIASAVGNNAFNSTANTTTTGTGNSGNLQPYLVTNYIIKALKVTPEGTKITDLRELSSLDDSDIIPVVDVSADETMKITKANFQDSLSIKQIYSTTEQVIGTWKDGKPLYRICVSGQLNGTYVSSNLRYTWISSGLSNVSVKKIDFYANVGDRDVATTDSYYIDNISYVTSGGNKDKVQIGSNTTNVSTSTVIDVVLEYTKSSDTV